MFLGLKDITLPRHTIIFLFFSSILLWSVINTITIYNNAYTDFDDKQWATIVTTTTKTTTTIVMKLRMAKTPHRWVVAMELVKQ
jgi:hypothetical protein